ncbi:MAG: DUF3194 domain-containing protein [Candidatus Bathyarchaeota archaeon]|nr:DUF3194 domain-containing protein [Candidatus Bathyarchaeota archaeon]MDH5663538.1 DUF3194 domain-containing protein [Candidatus Bathyarchaeota archaeon]
MEEIGILELTLEQVEELCEIAEETAREYVLSKVPPRRISTLNVTVDAEGTKPITINVDVEVVLSPLMKNFDVEKLVKEATERAFASIRKYLRKLSCKSTK